MSDDPKTESRNAKLLRQLNEQFDKDTEVVKGMSRDEKRVLAILLAAAAVLALLLGVIWSGIAHADEMTVEIQCPKNSAVCFGSKAQILALIAHNNAVTTKLAEVLAARGCDLSKS